MIALLGALVLVAAPPTWRPDAPTTSEIDLPRFHIHATAGAEATARLLAGELEADRDFVATRLGGDYPGITEVRVGEGLDEVRRLELPGAVPPDWAAGLAHPGQNLILLDARQLRREGGVGLVRHELAHVALGAVGGDRLPRWFQEGVAVLVAGEWDTRSSLAMLRASRNPIALSDLERGFPDSALDVQLAYAESASFVEYLFAQHGIPAVRKVIAQSGAGKPFGEAFASVIGPEATEEAAWLKSIKLRYTWVPVLTGSTTLFGLMGLLCFWGYARLRRRKQRLLDALGMEEQAELAAERIIAAERLAELQAAELQAAELLDESEPSQPDEQPYTKPTLH